MTFQERNGTCGMKPERSERNLAEKSGMDRDLKWDEICSVLFRFLNWYGMFQPFRAKRNGIDNLVCTKWMIIHSKSSPYKPKMNGVVEVANKNLKKIMQKMVVTYKDWHEMLPYALHAYHTIFRISTSATPYSLAFVMDMVMPIEVKIPSFIILNDVHLEASEWIKLKFKQLNLIIEKRLATICHHQLYQGRIDKVYN